MPSLNDSVVLLTGGATGIGRAIALDMAAAGATVAIGDTNIDDGQRTAQEILSAGGRRPSPPATWPKPIRSPPWSTAPSPTSADSTCWSMMPAFPADRIASMSSTSMPGTGRSPSTCAGPSCVPGRRSPTSCGARGAPWSTSPRPTASSARRWPRRTVPPRAASSTSPDSWPSTTVPTVFASTPSAPGTSTPTWAAAGIPPAGRARRRAGAAGSERRLAAHRPPGAGSGSGPRRDVPGIGRGVLHDRFNRDRRRRMHGHLPARILTVPASGAGGQTGRRRAPEEVARS